MGLFDYLARHPDKGAEFQSSMVTRSRQEAAAVTAAYDFWDDAAAIRILTCCREAMPAAAALLLVEAVLPRRAREQPGAVRMDLHMLTLLHGRERTVDEYQALLAAAGLELRRVVPALPAAGLCVVEAARGAAR
jgi:hypothetical protein